MPLTLDENHAPYQIRSYQPGLIQVNENTYYCSIILTPEKLIDHWRPQKIADLTKLDLDIILELQPTIFILGTGSHLKFPPIETYGDLMNAHIGVEIMNSRAACLTYTALTAENRRVAAAIIIS